MMSSTRWINLGNAGKEFKITSHQLEKKSKLYTGKGNPNFGKTHTLASRQRISEARKIKGGTHYQPHSDETKAAIREKTMNQIASGNIAALIKWYANKRLIFQGWREKNTNTDWNIKIF